MESKDVRITSGVLYGGTDGIITTFAIMIACITSNQSNNTVIALALANIFADGFAIGISSYESNIHNENNPLLIPIVTFLSFSLMGSIPVIVFYLYKDEDYKTKLYAIVVSSMIVFFLLGMIKQYVINNKYSQKTNLLIGGLKTASVGACGGIIAYIVTKIITNLMITESKA